MAMPRAAMAVVALLRERPGAAVSYLVSEVGGSGGPLPVRLCQLAASALAARGATASVTVVATAPWTQGSFPAARLEQAAWQRRVRVAQEALTLLRALLVTDATAVAAADELLRCAALGRETLVALTRLSKAADVGAPPRRAPTVAELPLAAWARAVGSSSVAPSISEPSGARAGLPCASAEDVAYMALRLRARLLVP
jgi:hypothetical protein